jgi:ABC-type multidrug transport system ATPase subunit
MFVNNILIRNDKPSVSFVQNNQRCCVICSKQDEDTTLLLRKLGGLETLAKKEEVQFNESESACKEPEIGYFFKRGILLSNLTLQENIELPYKYFNPKSNWHLYEDKLLTWLEFFKLDVDISQRPSMVNYSIQKLISYVRNLILQPDIYVFDDPFFQLSCIFRKKIVDCLLLLKEHNNFLVMGTSDLELIELLADDLLVLEKGEIIGNYDLTGCNREQSMRFVCDYLNE